MPHTSYQSILAQTTLSKDSTNPFTRNRAKAKYTTRKFTSETQKITIDAYFRTAILKRHILNFLFFVIFIFVWPRQDHRIALTLNKGQSRAKSNFGSKEQPAKTERFRHLYFLVALIPHPELELRSLNLSYTLHTTCFVTGNMDFWGWEISRRYFNGLNYSSSKSETTASVDITTGK